MVLVSSDGKVLDYEFPQLVVLIVHIQDQLEPSVQKSHIIYLRVRIAKVRVVPI